MTIGAPQSGHFSSVGRSGARGLRSDLVYLHSGSFCLVHAMYGPNRPALRHQRAAALAGTSAPASAVEVVRLRDHLLGRTAAERLGERL